MPVNCKTVQGRRKLKFSSFEEVIADAEKLASSPHTRTLGNWPLSQLLTHVALAINKSIDGISVSMPWHTRLLGVLIKRRILKNGLPPGFKLPKDKEAGAYPAASSPRDALETLRRSVERTKTEKMSARHPVLGRLSHEEWTQFHLHHAALHLSFVVPICASTQQSVSIIRP
jgi:Protein of unknown function (DUF1569)